jgi:MoaA/NifB/PqqE/SkfB family radical SAM enzyme
MDLLHIYHTCDWARCDLACSYCISQASRKRKTSGGNDWLTPSGRERFLGIVDWVATLDRPLGVKIQPVGEPLLSTVILAGVARLAAEPHVRFVELATNGTHIRRALSSLPTATDVTRLTLWITYHDGQVDPADFVARAVHARDLGCSVVVNTVALPENLAGNTDLVRRARGEGLPTNVDLGLDMEGWRTGGERVPVLRPEHREGLAALLQEAGHDADPASRVGSWFDSFLRPCTAGRDYLCVEHDGSVWPCRGYALNLPETRMGSALERGFRPPPRDQPAATCRSPRGCGCAEDVSHLCGERRGAPIAGSVRGAGPPDWRPPHDTRPAGGHTSNRP